MSFSKEDHIVTLLYKLHNSLLMGPEFIKELGVYFDPKLAFVSHIDNTITEMHTVYLDLLFEI